MDPKRLVTGPEATHLPATATSPVAPPEYTPHSYGFMLFAVEADGYGGFSATLADGRQWLYASKYDFSGDSRLAYEALFAAAWNLAPGMDLEADPRVKLWPNGERLPVGDPHTLCSTPRCSYGDNHLRPCNQDAAEPE